MNNSTTKILNGQSITCKSIEELQSVLSELSEDGILWRNGSKIYTTYKEAAMIFNNGQVTSTNNPEEYGGVILSKKKPNTSNSRPDCADPKAILCFECLKSNS